MTKDPERRTMRLLVCHASPLLAEALCALLETRMAGAQVTCTSDIDAAAAAVSTAGPFDLALCDGTADPAAGVKIIQRLRAVQSGLVVAVTADKPTRNVVAAAMAAGAAGVLPTDMPAAMAIAVIELLIDGGRYVPPLASRDPAGTAATPTSGRGGLPPLDAASALHRLSPRQIDVLRLLSRGESNKTIARALRMGENTVKTHVKEIIKRLNVRNRTEAAFTAARIGLADQPEPKPDRHVRPVPVLAVAAL
ncbi:MAG TPA: response regulator transcription factor [Alphaproteobacteria bacterium]